MPGYSSMNFYSISAITPPTSIDIGHIGLSNIKHKNQLLPVSDPIRVLKKSYIKKLQKLRFASFAH